MNYNAVMSFMQRHYLKNRTIVSKDIMGIIEDVAAYIGIEPMLYRYPTGNEYSTWDIPPRWDVREAWLKDENGNVIASYEDHPLFLAPYSVPFHGLVSFDVLRQHVSIHPSLKNAYFYEHRLAYNSQMRLKDWRISLPANVLEKLNQDLKYEVYIDVDIEHGEMLVAEFILHGKYEDTVALLADYCHPGQVNDSFSGMAVHMEVFKSLTKKPQRNFTYSLMLFPETIGSSVMLATKPEYISKITGAIFCEMVAWGGDWVIKKTFSGDTYMDMLADVMCIENPNIKTISFNEGAGNDEIVFDWAGIPSISLQRYPYDEYHSSEDNLKRVDIHSIEQSVQIILEMLNIIEQDRIWRCAYPVPFYMSKFNLYNDAILEKENYFFSRNLLFNLDGRQSLLEIAHKLGKPFKNVIQAVKAMDSHKLVQAGGLGLIGASKKRKSRILADADNVYDKK